MASVDTGGKKETVELNVIPLLDVFSILIVFLLMSFSTDPVSYDVNAGVELPESKTLVALDEIPTIVVAKNEILVNDKKVAAIFNGDVAEKDKSQGAVYPVYEELAKLAEANKRLRERKLGPKSKAKTDVITMEMDQMHRFMLMRRVMLAAQQAEFITFKLMVSKDE